jgi:hypothetical protein
MVSKIAELICITVALTLAAVLIIRAQESTSSIQSRQDMPSTAP